MTNYDATLGTAKSREQGIFAKPDGRVLPTLNEDGSRRWLKPKPSPGRFMNARLVVAWLLIGLFTAIPYIEIGGKPAMLLDIVHRRFSLFGATFYATDTILFMLFMVASITFIFLLTALLGRAWCGWACPQTVYMEFLFRPIERFFDGSAHARRTRGRANNGLRKAGKWFVYGGLSFYLAHTFLAYFVGVDALGEWVLESPTNHPVAFAVVMVTTGLMLFNFGVFREQTCLVACPYGRFQSVLLDRRSLIIGYDDQRGEPRGKVKELEARREAGQAAGDCIDCRACVVTCPTGIDIRDGLQMECVACAQCIDACDAIMVKIGKPRGLVRYTSQDELAGKPRRLLRWRTVIYPVLMVGALAGFIAVVAGRSPAEITVLRGIGTPFTRAADGQVTNQIRIKIHNRGVSPERYRIELVGVPEANLITPLNPMPAGADKKVETTAFVLVPERVFEAGMKDVDFKVSDEHGFSKSLRYRLLGPRKGTSP